MSFKVHVGFTLSNLQLSQNIDQNFMPSLLLWSNKSFYFVEKHQSPSFAKSSSYRFCFQERFDIEKTFQNWLENMVLEPSNEAKRSFMKRGLIFLSLQHPNIVYRIFDQRGNLLKIKKLLPTFWALHVKRIEVVTLSSENAFAVEGISFSILPFWEWALQL